MSIRRTLFAATAAAAFSFVASSAFSAPVNPSATVNTESTLMLIRGSHGGHGGHGHGARGHGAHGHGHGHGGHWGHHRHWRGGPGCYPLDPNPLCWLWY